MIVYAYIWGNVDDPDLYSEWDFDVSISLHANRKHFSYIDWKTDKHRHYLTKRMHQSGDAMRSKAVATYVY